MSSSRDLVEGYLSRGGVLGLSLVRTRVHVRESVLARTHLRWREGVRDGVADSHREGMRSVSFLNEALVVTKRIDCFRFFGRCLTVSRSLV